MYIYNVLIDKHYSGMSMEDMTVLKEYWNWESCPKHYSIYSKGLTFLFERGPSHRIRH